jgi:quercetin dioxygenase-like cupin family protein
MVAQRSSDLTWSDLGLVPGVQIAVLSGNPGEAGHYVLRLKFPPNTRMPAHWHPQAEYATILSGTLLLGMGTEEKPEGLEPYAPGSFLVVPPGMSHYGMSTDEVIFELSGPGPYEVVFVDDADDPRKR